MEAKQYRIGNWIYDIEEQQNYQIEEICKLSKDSLNQDLGIRYRNGSIWSSSGHGYGPIPLTEEWLVKFGFSENKSTKDFFFNYLICLERQGNELFVINTNDKYQYKIEYVHQLQNIHFALTGEELNLI